MRTRWTGRRSVRRWFSRPSWTSRSDQCQSLGNRCRSVCGVNARWSPLPEQAALEQAGAPSTVWSDSPVTYALGPAALVMVIEAGDRPGGSAVDAADTVILRPPVPAEVVEVLTADRFPLPIRGF